MNVEVSVPTARSFGMTMAIAQALPSDISLWTLSEGAKGHLTGSDFQTHPAASFATL